MAENIQLQSTAFPKISSKTTLTDLVQAVMNSPATTPEPPNPSDPASENPAVARCCQAYARALNSATAQGITQFRAASEAEKAYRNAMPALSGPENIRDFIACIAHAMLIGAISGPDGARLLYAAQVAHTTLNAPTQKNKSSRESAPKPENA